jgi:hypothetical protein
MAVRRDLEAVELRLLRVLLVSLRLRQRGGQLFAVDVRDATLVVAA